MEQPRRPDGEHREHRQPDRQQQLPRRQAGDVSSSRAGAIHTQWCPQEIGETNSPATATASRPVNSSPARLARTTTIQANATMARLSSTHRLVVTAPGNANRSSTPRMDWFLA